MQYKKCKHPLHEGNIRLPHTEEYWYFYKTGSRKGTSHHPCIACKLRASRKVKTSTLTKPLNELALRCDGLANAAIYCGLSWSTLDNVMKLKFDVVHRTTATKIISALIRKRREDRLSGSTSKTYHSTVKTKALNDQRIERSL